MKLGDIDLKEYKKWRERKKKEWKIHLKELYPGIPASAEIDHYLISLEAYIEELE